MSAAANWERRMAEERGEYHTGAGDTSQPAEAENVVPLLGSVTGYAKEVVRNIRRAAISAQMKDFLLEVYARSFGNAGYQRRAGLDNPGGSCAFDNAAWAHELGMQRQHMYRLRVKAVELGILFYDEDASDPSAARLRWNLSFEEWQPLDSEYRRQRYSRPGAGRKSNGLRMVASENNSNGLRSSAENKSNGLRKQIKWVTPDCLECGQEAAPGAPLRKEKKEITEEIDANASSAACAAAPSPTVARSKAKPVKVVKPARELSPRDQYRVDLLAAVKEANDGRATGEHGMEWKAAGMLYDWPTGPADIAAIVECFTITRRLPKYDTKELHLMDLVAGAKHYAAYVRSGADAYRKGIERSRAAADGTLGSDRPPARVAPQHEPPPMRLNRDRPLNAKPAQLD